MIEKIVNEIMIENPISVSPDTTIIDAIQLIEHNRVSCLPVVKNKKLIGWVTEYDFVKMTAILLQQTDTEIPVKKR